MAEAPRPPEAPSLETQRATPQQIRAGPLHVTCGAVVTRVLCVDDHALLIEGLRAQLGLGGKVQVVGALASTDRLIEEAARLRPDIVLLDIEMPGPDVFETVDRLKRSQPEVRTVFLSAHVRDGYLTAAFQCGAWGYFSKADAPEDIAAGVREVARSLESTFVVGEVVRKRLIAPRAMPGRAHARSAASEVSDMAPPLRSLTERELEVLRLIGRGLSRNEIASELCRSVKTIDGHQERIMKKLGIATRPELLRFAIREGLAEA